MTYYLDTNSIEVLKNFYPTTFASLWKEINLMVALGELGSVEEVYNEATKRNQSTHVAQWLQSQRHVFSAPSPEEMDFVAQIFQVPHFQMMVSHDSILRGGHVADPWLIARAKVAGGCVVTEERLKPNAAKIPNVCQHFGIECCDVEGLFTSKGWRY